MILKVKPFRNTLTIHSIPIVMNTITEHIVKLSTGTINKITANMEQTDALVAVDKSTIDEELE